jgi:hypothetical protein
LNARWASAAGRAIAYDARYALTDCLTCSQKNTAWIGQEEAPIHRSDRHDIVKYAIATEQTQQKYRGDEAPPMFIFTCSRLATIMNTRRLWR